MKTIKYTLSGRETALIIVFVLLLLSLACWRFLFSPLRQSAVFLQEEQTALLQEQERIMEQEQQREELIKKWEERQTRAEMLHEAVPSLEKLPQVLTRLESLLNSSPVLIHSLRIGELEHGEAYSLLRVKLRLSAETDSILNLLKKLEQFEHILLIEMLSWAQDWDHTALLDLSFSLVFYNPKALSDHPVPEDEELF